MCVCVLLVCCSANLLPSDTVKGVSGKMVKFNTTLDTSQGYLTLSWNFVVKGEAINILTASQKTVKIVDAYKDRVKVNETTGMMELGPLTAADSGNYQLTVVTMDVVTLTGDTDLEVLGECTLSHWTFKTTVMTSKHFYFYLYSLCVVLVSCYFDV